MIRASRLLTVSAIGAALAFGGGLVPSAPAAEPDTQGVLAANAGFYAALNKMFTGNSAAMELVWSHAADVSYMGPTGGIDRGWNDVLKNWQGQAALKLGGKVEPAEVQTVVGQDVAVVTAYEEGENTNAKGEVAHLKLRATSTFRKEGGHWMMIGHHTDPLPYLAK